MSKHPLIWFAIFAAMALMFLRLPQMAAKQDAVLSTYGSLVEVDALVRQRYVHPIQDDRLVEGAIRGMLLQLDPYSGYVSPGELPAFERRSRGDFVGVGVAVGYRAGRLTVIAPIEGSPAAKAGVLAGDVLVSVDGLEVEGRSVFEVTDRLAGKRGTSVRLRLLHVGETEPEELELIRQPVMVQTIRGWRRTRSGAWDHWIDPASRIGYIRVSDFRKRTVHEFDQVLDRLLGGGLEALVLDLRFNPGGLMDQAVTMVDRFVEEGLILSTVNRQHAVHQYQATSPGTVSRIRLAVLVNGGSASAAEIVAGSLQDHHRAVVVGTRTFGKGSVQHLIRLHDHQAAIKLTVAHYRLPGGRIIHRTSENERSDLWGVMPDALVELTEEEHRAIQRCRRTMDASPPGATTPPVPVDSVARESGTPASDSVEPIHDRQLHHAMAVLRASPTGGLPAARP